MPNFTLERLQEVDGQIAFFKLVVDGYCPFDAFCETIALEGNLKAQLPGAVYLMNQVANLHRLSREQFRDITPARDKVKEYEIKRGDLRIYLIKYEGHIVVLGGKKGNQKKDIRKFKSLKSQYLLFK